MSQTRLVWRLRRSLNELLLPRSAKLARNGQDGGARPTFTDLIFISNRAPLRKWAILALKGYEPPTP